MRKRRWIVTPGCTVHVTLATDDGLQDAEYLISRGKTRLDEGVLNQRHRLARLMMGLSSGQVITPGGVCGIHWLRVNLVAPPNCTVVLFADPEEIPGPPTFGGEEGTDDVPF